MSSFSTMYKKAFKPILEPQGYTLWKSFFYKEIDRDVLLFIRLSKKVHSPMYAEIEGQIGVLPYCAKLDDNFELENDEFNWASMSIKLAPPDEMTNESLVEHLRERFDATDDERTSHSLNTLCSDLENLILPYIHRFSDLEFLRREYIDLTKHYAGNYVGKEIYGLSLKLHKYEKALEHIENRLTWHSNVVRRNKLDLLELQKGNIASFLQEKMKKDGDFLERYMAAIESDIARSEKEIVALEAVKTAVLADDREYIDRIVEETEERSREYIHQLLGVTESEEKSKSDKIEYDDTIPDECRNILDALSCDFELIPIQKGQKEIIDRFNTLLEQGKTEGFCPLIIAPTDILTEAMRFAPKDNGFGDTPENIVAYREHVIEGAAGIDGQIFLSSQFEEIMGRYEDIDFLGEFTKAHPQCSLDLPMYEYESCENAIIAKIPTKNPWELAAWIPMGGFNDCPVPEEQVAVFRHWYEKYGAYPVSVTHDTWLLALTKPPLTDEEAESLAKEHVAFCPDTVLQGASTVRQLASALKNSTVWYFWWD